MNESEQAQAIANIRARHTVPDIDTGRGGPIAHPDCVALLEIVDSQAQKIATLTQCNETQATQIARQFRAKQRVYNVCRANILWQREQRKLQAQKISEQAIWLEKVESLYAIARTQVEEQAKEIERLKSLIRKTGGFEP